MRASFQLALALFMIAPLAGCRVSLWEQRLTLTDDAPRARVEPSAVRVREVPWERLAPTLAELRAEVAESEAPVDEWPAEKRDEARGRLLRALQVTPSAGVTRVVGSSEFRTTAFGVPDERELRALASRLGATLVVWSSRHLGKSERVDFQPVTTWSSGTIWGRRDRHGRLRSEHYDETSTTWAPVVVEADETAFVAFFLR